MNDVANEIIPRLWLGNRGAALSEDWLREHGITTVFNASKDIPFANVARYQYRIPVDDNLEEEEIRNMALWAPEIVYNVLKHYYAGDTILVHCFAGMQRSAAIVVMTLIAMKQITAEQAIAFVRQRRAIAFHTGVNFERSIKAFEKYYNNELKPHLLASLRSSSGSS
jgi:protein-tyrosine phosphatase